MLKTKRLNVLQNARSRTNSAGLGWHLMLRSTTTTLPLLLSICLHFAEYAQLNSYERGLVLHKVATVCMSFHRRLLSILAIVFLWALNMWVTTICVCVPLFVCLFWLFLIDTTANNRKNLDGFIFFCLPPWKSILLSVRTPFALTTALTSDVSAAPGGHSSSLKFYCGPKLGWGDEALHSAPL